MAPQERQLSNTQQRAASEIQSALISGSGKRLVLLEGLGGSGKTAVLGSLNDALASQKVAVNDHLSYSIGYGEKDNTANRQFSAGNVVSPANPYEAERITNGMSKAFPEVEVISCVLKGMTFPESLQLVKRLKGDGKTLLTDDLLAEYSLGLPLLVERLLVDPNLSEDNATQMVGSYLGRQLPDDEHGKLGLYHGVNYYLQMDPPDVVMTAARAVLRNKHIYDYVGPALDKIKDLKQQGIDEESPFFIASKSVEIYNEMLKLRAARARAGIDIFVPQLEEQDLKSVARSLGIGKAVEISEYWLNGDPGMNLVEAQDEAIRFRKVFGHYYRKTAIWFRGLDGETGLGHSESRDAAKHAQNAEKDFLAGNLPLKPSDSGNFARLFFHKHAHHDETHDPANGGWIIESMLQQRGISYLVSNGVLDTSYFYDPGTQSINFADFNITRKNLDDWDGWNE
jgi:hypothetical protein